MKVISNKRKKYLKLLRKIELIRISKCSYRIEITPIFESGFGLSWRDADALMWGES